MDYASNLRAVHEFDCIHSHITTKKSVRGIKWCMNYNLLKFFSFKKVNQYQSICATSCTVKYFRPSLMWEYAWKKFGK